MSDPFFFLRSFVRPVFLDLFGQGCPTEVISLVVGRLVRLLGTPHTVSGPFFPSSTLSPDYLLNLGTKNKKKSFQEKKGETIRVV